MPQSAEEIAAAAAAAATAEAEAEAARVAAATATAEAAAAAAKNKNKPDAAAQAAAVAAAEAEVETMRARLAAAEAAVATFDGLDPVAAKAAIAAAAAAETARLDAEKAKAKAEGDFEKLREIQHAEQTALIEAANQRATTAETAAASAVAQLNQARIETAFANSPFIQNETILTGPRAQRLYADHVEIVDGKVVVFDKPAGEDKRARIMDGKGNALPFDAAIQKIIGAEPDKDTLMKSKAKPGAASTTTDGKVVEGASRHEKLRSGLKALREG